MATPDAVFYFDLSSPPAYLAAEQVLQALPGPAEWRPVLAAELPGSQPFQAFRCRQEEQAFREDLTRRAAALGLQPLRWPSPFPFDSTLAMRAATYARSIGRTVPFAQAAFRQAFAGGRSLGDPENVLIAAAACEIHPSALLGAAELRSIDEQLRQSTAHAAALGVSELPAVWVDDVTRESGGTVFAGEASLGQAAAHMRAARTPPVGSR